MILYVSGGGAPSHQLTCRGIFTSQRVQEFLINYTISEKCAWMRTDSLSGKPLEDPLDLTPGPLCQIF
jgi:hypothetical protein